jgi:hypothetical protein
MPSRRAPPRDSGAGRATAPLDEQTGSSRRPGRPGGRLLPEPRPRCRQKGSASPTDETRAQERALLMPRRVRPDPPARAHGRATFKLDRGRHGGSAPPCGKAWPLAEWASMGGGASSPPGPPVAKRPSSGGGRACFAAADDRRDAGARSDADSDATGLCAAFDCEHRPARASAHRPASRWPSARGRARFALPASPQPCHGYGDRRFDAGREPGGNPDRAGETVTVRRAPQAESSISGLRC